MSEKIKVKSRHISLPSPAANYSTPQIQEVITQLTVEEEGFAPIRNEKGTAFLLKALLPWDHSDANRPNQRFPIQLPHRSTVLVNCGITMTLPAGFKANIAPTAEMASKGLMVVPAIYGDKVEVYVTNVGREIVVLNHGDPFAQMTIEPVYNLTWES